MNFTFDTNILRRMPDTGTVFAVDRMTSAYAETHPLDVDAFLSGVCEEFRGTEFEETAGGLRRLWDAVLAMPDEGDATLYPNAGGARRAAAMKVWHTAGDYWRRGFRPGDVLPGIVPSARITRLPDGSWISLFPSDMHLLEQCDTAGKAPRAVQLDIFG